MNTKLLFILDIYFPRMEPPKFPGSDGEVWDGKLSVWGYPRVSYCNDLSCNHQQCPPTGEFEGVNQENNNTLFEAIKAFFGQAEPKIVFQLGEHCVEMKLEEKTPIHAVALCDSLNKEPIAYRQGLHILIRQNCPVFFFYFSLA